MKRHTIAFAPASISNLGSGFDVIGLALAERGDYIVVELTDDRGVELRGVEGDGGLLSRDTKRSIPVHVATTMLKDLKAHIGIAITLHARTPVKSGLGSSASSAVAAAVAVNALLGNPFTKDELLRYAVDGERFMAGAGHADNVSPSLFGGVTLVRDTKTLDIVRLPVPRRGIWVVVHPHIQVRTAHARRILPKNVPLTKAVCQWGNVGGVVAGFCSGDLDLLGRSIEDVIIEPVRSRLIPGFHAVKSAAMKAGALACSISGSGPSMFALVEMWADSRRVGKAMQKAFRGVGLKSDLIISRISEEGAHVVSWVGQ
jgi:homoserine kinase